MELDQKPRPRIYVNGKQQSDIKAEAVQALVDSNDPPSLFNRDGGLARVELSTDTYGTSPVIKPVSAHGLHDELDARAVWLKTVKAGTEIIELNTTIPRNLAEDIHSRGELPGLVPLTGLTQCPVFRPDGTILDKPGYDTATGYFYYADPKLKMPKVPEDPMRQDIQRACDLIQSVLIDYRFAEPADAANALAGMFSPVVRPCYRGNTPLCLVDATAAGSGKTLLVDVFSVISSDDMAYKSTAPGSDEEEEWRKELITVARAGVGTVLWDNLTGVLKSPYLSEYLTSGRIKGRLLGSNTDIAMRVFTVMYATGNNIAVGGDLPRRSYPIRIDTGLEKPSQRAESAFQQGDLLDYVKRERGELLWAILTLGKAWFVAGMPPPTVAPPMGSFEQWRRTVGGIIENIAGVKGFLGNAARIEEVTDTIGQWERWYSALRTVHPGEVTTPELVAILHDADFGHPLIANMPDEVGAAKGPMKEANKDFSLKLGQLLSKQVGTVCGGYVLERGKPDGHRRAPTWRVVETMDHKGGNQTGIKFNPAEFDDF